MSTIPALTTATTGSVHFTTTDGRHRTRTAVAYAVVTTDDTTTVQPVVVDEATGHLLPAEDAAAGYGAGTTWQVEP